MEKESNSLKIENRKSISAPMKKFYGFAKESDFITVTEWSNGEGWDISLNGKPVISLHYSEVDAMNYLMKTLEYD